MVKEGNHPPKYAMFWDFENMMLAGEILDIFLKDLSLVITNLSTSRAERLRAECYGRWGLVSDGTQETLSNFGFHLIQVPKVGDNALDALLIANALILAKEGQCTHFILIASDGDYCNLCAQLCDDQVSVSIIGRATSFSSDYLKLPLKTYFVGKGGHLLQNVVKDKAAQVHLVGAAMKDASAALGNMQNMAGNAGIQVFSYVEWGEQYRKLETHEIPPFQLARILSLADFFRCFLEIWGYSPSKDFTHFYCGTQGGRKNLEDIDIFQKLPPLCVFSSPVDPHMRLEDEMDVELVNKLGKAGKITDLSFLLQPDYVQLGREVMLELVQVHPGYKHLFFDILWSTLLHRSKELAAMNISSRQVPIEFYEKTSAGDDRFKVNAALNQWDLIKQTKIVPPPALGEYRCSECNRKFKNAQALANHQNSAIHKKKIKCPNCNRQFLTTQALADHVRDKHKK